MLPAAISSRLAEHYALKAAGAGDIWGLEQIFARAELRSLAPDRSDWLARHCVKSLLGTAASVAQRLERLGELDFLPLAERGRPARLYRQIFRDHLRSLDPASAGAWALGLPRTIPIDLGWPLFRLAEFHRAGVPISDADLEATLADVDREADLAAADLAQLCVVLHAHNAVAHLDTWRAEAARRTPSPSVELARLHLDTGQRSEALAVVDQVLSSHPDDRFALLLRARVLRTMNKEKSAVSAYERLLSSDPNDRAAQSGLLQTYRAMRRPAEEVLAEIDQWAASIPGSDDRRFFRADLLLAGDLPRRAFQEAWALRENQAKPEEVGRLLFRCLAALGEYAVAEHFLRACEVVNPSAAEKRFLRQASQLRLLLGGRELGEGEALATCRALVEQIGTDPGFEEVLDAALAKRRIRLPEALMDLAADLVSPLHSPPQSRPGPICIVSSSLGPGGAERQLVATVRGLKERLRADNEIVVLCPGLNEHARSSFFLPDLCGLGVPVVVPVLRSLDSESDGRSRDSQRISQLLHLWPRWAGGDLLTAYYGFFAERRPMIVHAWQDTTMLLAGFAALLAGVPRIVLSGQSLRPYRRPYQPEYLRSGFRSLSERGQVVLTNNSVAGTRDYASWLGRPVESLMVLRNGLSFDEIEARRQSTEASVIRTELGIPPGAPIAGAVMRMSEEKRPHLCLDIMFELLRSIPNCHALLIGDGPLWEEVTARGRASAHRDRIHFPGTVTPVEPWMATMDVLISTSRVEGIPNVLLEAQAVGLPVVATDAGGSREAFLEGKSGFLFPNEDPMEMAAIVARFLMDSAVRRTAGQTARTWVRGQFSTEKMIDATLHAYGFDS